MSDQETIDLPTFKRIWESMDEVKKAKVREYVAIFMDFRESIDKIDFHESNRKLESVTALRDECEKLNINELFLTTLSRALAHTLLGRNDRNGLIKFIDEKIIEKQDVS